MADEEQLDRLKKDTHNWNVWRKEKADIEIDLRGAYLEKADLEGVNLSKADLRFADFFGANLRGANLVEANLQKIDLRKANLERAEIYLADLRNAHLSRADLRGADLRKTNLDGADLGGADLGGALLRETNLCGTRFSGTGLGNIDLSETKGLDEVVHDSSSPISTSTLELFKGKFSVKFLRGCGLRDFEIEFAKIYGPGLSADEIDKILYRMHDLRVGNALQINPLFISYSHQDRTFVDEMEKHLNEKGVRFWRDIHNATAGRLEKVVDRAMRKNPTVLLILSENSVKSDWVEHEARTARELEKELGRDVLCPVALDEAWKDCKWPARLREQIMEYNILDFSKWEDKEGFEMMFKKLVDGLDLFYKA